MTAFLQFFTSLREQMSATLTRSDILRALIWPIGILAAMTVAIANTGPNWLLVVVAVMLVMIVFLYCASFVFCLGHDRDALRSERYSLQKLAIERHLIGDSATGIIDSEDDPYAHKLVDARRIEKKTEHDK
jgi:hypothetical protein